MFLQVFPEPQRQRGRQAGQSVVVDGGLTFSQVVDQQFADGAAGQVVAVDELLDGELTGEARAEHADRRRCVCGEDAQGVQ